MIIVLIAGTLSLCWSFYRDLQIEKLTPGDLRNRVVGARLQKDGQMPYFYKWRSTDGLRYYDPQNFDSLRAANITASPYFHDLLYPIADMPQRTISHLWLYLQYMMLFTMVGIALSLAVTEAQKILVLALSASFLFTEAWISLVENGQLYLFVPFLAMLFYFFLGKPKSFAAALLAGLCAVSMVLIRPNAMLLFLPFLFIIRKFSLRYKIAFFIPVFGLLAYSAGNSRQRNLWLEYEQNISEQIKIHQGKNAALQENAKDPQFNLWEGWNREELKKLNAATPFAHSENGNLFVLIKLVFGKKLSTTFLTALSFSFIFLMMLMFYFFHRRSGFNVYNLAILGFCLYMASDLFSPVYRHQYYTAQWFFPLLLAAAGFIKNYKLAYMAIVAGLILNITNLPFMKMEHTLGEYIIFAALLLLAFIYKNPAQLGHHNSTLPSVKN